MTTTSPTVIWRVNAYEPDWMPADDFTAVCDWLRDNHALHLANADHDLTVVDVDGHREIHGHAKNGTPTSVPLVTEPPQITRPQVPHLEQLQAVLAKHCRADLPAGPLTVFGDCLAEEAADLRPGGYCCYDCTRATPAEAQYVAWPCKPVREAAALSGVTPW